MSGYANGMFEQQAAVETWLGERLTTAEYMFASRVRLDMPGVPRETLVAMLECFRDGFEAGYEEARS